jgi:hypothetical protein
VRQLSKHHLHGHDLVEILPGSRGHPCAALPGTPPGPFVTALFMLAAVANGCRGSSYANNRTLQAFSNRAISCLIQTLPSSA